VGLLLDPSGTALPMDVVVAHELELYGSHGMAAADYPAMLALVTSGAVRLRDLVGAVISLEEAPAALMAMDRAASPVPGITVVDLSR
jgi:alcohol dehydrogenase